MESALCLMAREPGKVWRIYTMDSEGGNLTPVLHDARNEADPSWSADGSSIAFGRLPELMCGKISAEVDLYSEPENEADDYASRFRGIVQPALVARRQIYCRDDFGSK